jgi:uncharacterized protein (TIGR02266 family)
MAMNFFCNPEKFDVTIVHEGQEALRRVSEGKPDLAIFDLNLPGKAGAECCKEIKRAGLSPETPVVLAVRVQNSGDVKQCLEAACDALLAKPMGYESLAGIVTRFLFGMKSVIPRIDVRLSVRYGVRRHKASDDFSVNLSTGGIFLEARKIVPVGTPLDVTFTLPDDGTTINCTAQVAWLNEPALRCQPLLPAGMGLKFLDIDTHEVNAIRKFLFSTERLHYI